MERNILVEGNHQGDSTLMSKSSRSLIKIDSISIDLVNGNEKNEVGKCEHFSIRGYVSEIRKKDRKICWPFSIDDKYNKSEEQQFMLPPLQVSKFRWWRCQNCLQEIDAKGTAKEIGMVPTCCNAGFKSSTACSHMSSHGDAAMLSSDFQQASKLDYTGGRKVDANASTIVNSDLYCLPSCNERKEKKAEVARLPSCSDKKEKKAEVACTIILGQENGSEDDANQEIPRPTYGATKFNPCLMRERHTDDTVVLKSKFNGSVESCKPNCGSHEVVDNVLAIRNLKCMVNGSAGVAQTENGISVDDKHEEVITTCGTSGVLGEVNAKGHTNEISSLELDTHDYASSEGDEILVEKNLQDQHHNNSGVLHHRKAPKVRLLTELLGANGYENAGPIRIEDAPSNTSAGLDSLSVPQVHVAVQGNVRRGFKDQSRKRKIPCDEDWKPPEMSCPNNANKKVRIFKGDAENTSIAIASSIPEEDTVAGIGLQAATKNHWTKHAIDGNPILSKKKTKKTQVDDGCSSLVPSQEVVPKENKDKCGNADKCSAADTASAFDAFTGRVMDPLLKNFLPAQRTVRKSSLCKKKNKMPQVENMQASLIPWNDSMLGEGSHTRQNVEMLQTGHEIAPFQSVQDASTGIGPYHSLESYLSAQRNNMKHIPQIEDGLESSLPWQEFIFRDDQIMRKDLGIKHVGDSSVSLNFGAGPFIEKGAHCDFNIKRTTHRTSLMGKKKNWTSLVEDGDCSLMRKTDFSGTSNGEKMIGVQDSGVTKKHNDLRADFEQGALDDIPMDIVETLRLLQEENSHLQKPQPRNARKNIFPTSEHVGPSKQKSISYFPQLGQPEGNHASGGFGSFSQCREKLASEVQFSATGSSSYRDAQNCKWDGGMLGHRSSSTSLQALKVYDTCETVSQQSEKAAGVWSSMIPNHISYGLNIPQNCAAQSVNIDMLSQCPGTQHKGRMNGDRDLKFFNPNIVNLEEQNRNFGSETFNKTHAEYPYAFNQKGIEFHPKLMGSLDMYSNETIPAMHLLSLMDAGMPSSTPFNMDGNEKFLKRASFPHDNHSKEFSELDIGVYKASHTSRHPSSDYYRKNHLSEKSCECFPSVPTVGAFASSFQNDVNFRRATGFTGQVPLKSREKGKAKVSYSPTQNRGPRSRKSVSTSVALGTNHEFVPVHDIPKMFLGASDLTVYPSQCHTIEDSRKYMELEAHGSYGTVWPVKRCSETGICSVNRNPADFSLPEVANVYTIGAEDLKFGKTTCSKDRYGSISVDGHKRQRIMKKLTAGKGRARHQVS